MSKKRIKVSELTPASSLVGFYTLGYKQVEGESKSVKMDLSYVQKAYENTVDATGKANKATDAANKAASAANTKITDLRQLEAIVEEKEEERGNFYSRSQAMVQGWSNDEQVRKDAEADRELNETERQTKEIIRQEKEDERIVEEALRKKAEEGRDDNEAIRQRQEEQREEETTKAILNTEAAADRLNSLSDHRDEIRDGYWWRWNETTKEWYNTGEIAKGNVMFATFDLDPQTGVLTMITDPEYTGANFEVNEETGMLSVII